MTSSQKTNGGREYCIRKWFDGRTCRFVEFDLKRFSKPVDALNEDEAAAAQEPQPESGFKQLDIGEVTPFDNVPEAAELPY